MVEAMKKVRADFGEDAVILSSNIITSKGFLGFFRKKSVEVVAGFDDPLHIPAQPTPVPKPAYGVAEPKQDEEMRREMSEMKRMLQEMKQSAAFANFPDDLKPLLTSLENQELSEELILRIGDEIFAQ